MNNKLINKKINEYYILIEKSKKKVWIVLDFWSGPDSHQTEMDTFTWGLGSGRARGWTHLPGDGAVGGRGAGHNYLGMGQWAGYRLALLTGWLSHLAA